MSQIETLLTQLPVPVETADEAAARLSSAPINFEGTSTVLSEASERGAERLRAAGSSMAE